MKTVCVLVHPGSFFTSGKAQVDGRLFDARLSGLLEEIETCDGLVVIDGSLSDGIPRDINAMIEYSLEEIAAEGGLAKRLWGCDSGEDPYRRWSGHGLDGDRLVYSGQEDAAGALVASGALEDISEIILCGAWATHDGSSGCVTSVKDTLIASGKIDPDKIVISDSCLFEEDMNAEPEAWDDEPVF